MEYENLNQIDNHFQQIGAVTTKLFSNAQIYFPKVHPPIGCTYKQKNTILGINKIGIMEKSAPKCNTLPLSPQDAQFRVLHNDKNTTSDGA